MSRRKKNNGRKITLSIDKVHEINAKVRNAWIHSVTEEPMGEHDLTVPPDLATQIIQPPQIVKDIQAGHLIWDSNMGDWVRSDAEPKTEVKSEVEKTLAAKLDVHIAKLEESNARIRATMAVLNASLRPTRVTPYARATRRAQSILDWLHVIVPKRLNKEDVGDALEQINAWASDPTCRHVRAKIVIKVVSTIVFATLNAIRFFMASLTGKKTD